MLLACLPFGPVVTSNDTFWPSLSVLKPCILIAEKCAKRSSPPPSGVMKPKPFASLNHFTVPVAIFGNSLSTRLNGTLPGRCFDLKESTAGKNGAEDGRQLGGRTRAVLYGLEQNTARTIRVLTRIGDTRP